MIANISPTHTALENTMNTLRYADRVQEMKKDNHQNSLKLNNDSSHSLNDEMKTKSRLDSYNHENENKRKSRKSPPPSYRQSTPKQLRQQQLLKHQQQQLLKQQKQQYVCGPTSSIKTPTNTCKWNDFLGQLLCFCVVVYLICVIFILLYVVKFCCSLCMKKMYF